MKTTLALFGAVLLCPALASAQYVRVGDNDRNLPEPLSFSGAPATGERGFVGFAFRLAMQDDEVFNTEERLTALLLEVRGRVSPFAEIFATVPIGSFNFSNDFGEASSTGIGNPAVGFLFTPPARGPGRAAFGFSVGIPVAQDDEAGVLGGLIANENNLVLFVPDILSLRPEIRLGLDGGLVSLQAQAGVDFAIDVNDNGNDEEFFRSGLSLGIKPVPVIAFLGEITFVDALNDVEDGITVLHFGGRGIINTTSGGLFQPGLEVFLPVSDAIEGLYDVGFALDLRATL